MGLCSPGPQLTFGTKAGVGSRGPHKPVSPVPAPAQKYSKSFLVPSDPAHTDSGHRWPKVDSNSNLPDPAKLPKDPPAFEASSEEVLAAKIKKLDEKLKQTEKRFLAQSASLQQIKTEEIDACFAKLAQDAEQSKNESLARLKSYFLSVNKAFQATKADVESQIANLNFTMHGKLTEPQIGAVRDRVQLLKRAIDNSFSGEFGAISTVRVAFNKSILTKIGDFCKIVGSAPSDAVNVFAQEENLRPRGGSPSQPENASMNTSNARRPSGFLNPAFPQKNLMLSEFLSEDQTRLPSKSKRGGNSGSFLSRNQNGPLGSSNAKSGHKLPPNSSLSPMPNGFRQLLRDQQVDPKEAELAPKPWNRPKETGQQVLLRAIAEDAIGLNLNGLGIDKAFLAQHREAFSKLRRLQLLHLDSNNIDDDAMGELKEIVARSFLEKVSLQFNHVTEKSLPLIRELCAGRQKLAQIDLTCNEVALSEEKKHQFESEMAQLGVALTL